MIARNNSDREVTTTIRDHDEETEILREFRTTYVDVLDPEMSHEEWNRASKKRRLVWRCPRQVSLDTAADLYGELSVYNGFHPSMVKELHKAFAGKGITVTPAREYSVAILLHVPNCRSLRERVMVFVRDNLNPDEVSWEEDGTLRLWWD